MKAYSMLYESCQNISAKLKTARSETYYLFTCPQISRMHNPTGTHSNGVMYPISSRGVLIKRSLMNLLSESSKLSCSLRLWVIHSCNVM